MKRIILLKSDSYFLLEQKLEEYILNKDNVTYFSLMNTSINEIVDDAGYSGMFGTDRTIIVRDTKYFGGKFLYEEDTKLLINFLTNINDINIVFICDDISKTKSSTKSLINIGALVVEVNVTDINSCINDYVNKLNVKIDKKAIDLLIKNSNSNLDIILSEINKYSIVTNTITEDIISKYGFKLETVDTFAFSNAVISKNFDIAFKLLDNYLTNGVDAYSLVGLLSSSFLNMYMVKDALSYNLSDEEIASALGYNNPSRVYVMKKNSRIYTLDNLKEIIYSLCELDKKIKKGYNPNNTIKEFLLSL